MHRALPGAWAFPHPFIARLGDSPVISLGQTPWGKPRIWQLTLRGGTGSAPPALPKSEVRCPRVRSQASQPGFGLKRLFLPQAQRVSGWPGPSTSGPFPASAPPFPVPHPGAELPGLCGPTESHLCLSCPPVPPPSPCPSSPPVSRPVSPGPRSCSFIPVPVCFQPRHRHSQPMSMSLQPSRLGRTKRLRLWG